MKTLDYERYLFQLIVQERGESFDSFLERLKCQLPKCKFSNEESRLRGQIINKCALNNLRDQAFGNYMALNQLILQAQTIEQAEKGYRTQPERENRREDSKSCSRCGFMDHEYFSPSCPAKNSRCESCKKFGHYARLCRTPNYARKRAGDRRDDLDDSANIKNKRLRDETSARDPRAARATAGQAGPSNPSTSSGGTNKVETPKHVTADNGNIYIDTNDSNAGTKSTSSTRNGMTSTQTSARRPEVPMVKIEPAANDKAAANAEEFFVCAVGGMQMKLVVRADCPVDAVMSKEQYRKIRVEKHIHHGGQKIIPASKFGSIKICGIFTSSIVTCSGYASSNIFVQESGDDFLVINENLAQHLGIKSKGENLKSPQR